MIVDFSLLYFRYWRLQHCIAALSDALLDNIRYLVNFTIMLLVLL